ncbi:hypothetical protein BN2497_3517 [Janthinobacterium sp. CG23_2]|nr:hypothetical protein BN2497_3517 [Janthinobacterium sp. CG23_2]CUU28156.1 hypothetical protein BN3177_3517 [Janthinobacterium sp. CG23_2]
MMTAGIDSINSSRNNSLLRNANQLRRHAHKACAAAGD